MNQIVSLFMFRCGDYEKVKQDVWEENWKAMRLYSVVALVAFGVITLVSVFSLSIGKFKWVYLVYTFLSLVYFCISRCQLRSFFWKKLVVYSFFCRAAAVRHYYGNADYTGGVHCQLHCVHGGSAAAVYRQNGGHERADSEQHAALYRTCFLCAAQPNSIQKPSECYSVRGAEYASDCHDDAKQAPENLVT